MSFQFGNLPYGYNPFSNGMTTMGGAFGDSPVWNLADHQVQAQMSAPLWANSGFSQTNPQNNLFNYNQNSSMDFYNSLLLQQSMATGSYKPVSPMNSMGEIFKVMMLMKQLEKLDEQVATERIYSSSSVDDDEDILPEDLDDEPESQRASTAKEYTFNSADPLKALKGFIKNEDADSELVYGHSSNFADRTYKSLKDSNENKTLTIDNVMKTFGINLNEMPEDDANKIRNNLEKFVTDEKSKSSANDISQDRYNALLNEFGISGASRKIKKEDMLDKIASFKTSSIKLDYSSTSDDIKNAAKAIAENLKDEKKWKSDDFGQEIDIKGMTIAQRKEFVDTLYEELKGEKDHPLNLGEIHSKERIALSLAILDRENGGDGKVLLDKNILKHLNKRSNVHNPGGLRETDDNSYLLKNSFWGGKAESFDYNKLGETIRSQKYTVEDFYEGKGF